MTNVLTSVDSGAALRLLASKCLYDFEVDLDPGGALYVPVGWWHEAVNPTPPIMLGHFYGPDVAVALAGRWWPRAMRPTAPAGSLMTGALAISYRGVIVGTNDCGVASQIPHVTGVTTGTSPPPR